MSDEALADFKRMIDRLLTGEVNPDWIAITVKTPSGRVALHSKDAPKRPRGLS